MRDTSALSERLARNARATTTGCWEWIGTRTPRGYGRLAIKGRQHYAHRLAYELSIGDIPAGLCIDHLCRNRACINPAHLEAVSPGENVRRGDAAFSGRTLCKNGLHDITVPANVRTYRSQKKCLPCVRENDRRTVARRKAARIARGEQP